MNRNYCILNHAKIKTKVKIEYYIKHFLKIKLYFDLIIIIIILVNRKNKKIFLEIMNKETYSFSRRMHSYVVLWFCQFLEKDSHRAKIFISLGNCSKSSALKFIILRSFGHHLQRRTLPHGFVWHINSQKDIIPTWNTSEAYHEKQVVF